MRQFSYRINDPIGLHARPATMIAKEAKNFYSEIILSANGKKANAKAMIMVMSMAVKQGTEVIVSAEGIDEEEAIKSFEGFFKDNL
ncbi:MAG: HPr family phosphocarrier protein [Mobilitalea sp.]